MTIKTAKRRHRMLWDWLAKTGGKKLECPYWERNGGTWESVDGFCFACEIDSRIGNSNCDSCPIVWPGRYCMANGHIGLFNQWKFALTLEDRKALAAQIRDLPWREK